MEFASAGETSKMDIEALCRMCHHELKADKSVNIFGAENTTSSPIAKQIEIFGGIDVSPQDLMSQKLCLECHLHLEKSQLIRMKCKNLDAKTRKHLRITSAGRVSRVFEENDDEFVEECAESMQIIKMITERLTDGQKAEIESEKIRNFDEASEISNGKLKVVEAEAKKNAEERLRVELMKSEKSLSDAVAEMGKMTEAHQAEIRRITDELKEKWGKQMELMMHNEPPTKRKQATTARDLGPAASTEDSAANASASPKNAMEPEVLVQHPQKMVVIKQEVMNSAADEQSEPTREFSDVAQLSISETEHIDQQFTCQQCPPWKKRSFISQKGLNRHMKGVHSSVSFNCKHCSTRRKYENDMKIHYRQKHPGIPQDYEKSE